MLKKITQFLLLNLQQMFMITSLILSTYTETLVNNYTHHHIPG
jgi:hypothetical protein